MCCCGCCCLFSCCLIVCICTPWNLLDVVLRNWHKCLMCFWVLYDSVIWFFHTSRSWRMFEFGLVVVVVFAAVGLHDSRSCSLDSDSYFHEPDFDLMLKICLLFSFLGNCVSICGMQTLSPFFIFSLHSWDVDYFKILVVNTSLISSSVITCGIPLRTILRIV